MKYIIALVLFAIWVVWIIFSPTLVRDFVNACLAGWYVGGLIYKASIWLENYVKDSQ